MIGSRAFSSCLPLVLSLLAACGPATEAPEAAAGAALPAVPTVLESMTQTFTPQSNRLWELAGNLYDDNGALEASRLTEPQWQELEAAAERMRQVALLLAESASVRVAADGAKIQSEGTPGSRGAAEVQALIDGDAQGFREEARKLVAIAEAAAAAARARDAARMDDASSGLNEVCTSCHSRFWYPQP